MALKLCSMKAALPERQISAASYVLLGSKKPSAPISSEFVWCCCAQHQRLAPQGGMLARLIPLFKLGLGGRLGDGQQWMPWIHLEDQVSLIDFLLNHEECRGPFNACAPQAVRNITFTQTLAREFAQACLAPCTRLGAASNAWRNVSATTRWTTLTTTTCADGRIYLALRQSPEALHQLLSHQ